MDLIRPQHYMQTAKNFKQMAIIAVHQHHVIAYEILAIKETVDGQRFKQFLITKLRPKLLLCGLRDPVILMDNARAHYKDVVIDYMERHGWEILDHPAYSPDMNPLDFEVNHKIKVALKGVWFTSSAMMVSGYDKRIQELNDAHSFHGIYNLPNVWETIVANNGSYN